MQESSYLNPSVSLAEENRVTTTTASVPSLPKVPQAADLARTNVRKVWIGFCFAITFLAYVALIPRFLQYSNPPTGDQPFYLMDTISMVQDLDLNVKNNYDNKDFDKFYALAPKPPVFVGMGAPYPLPAQLAHTTRPPEEWYSFHPPGLALLLIPSWVVGSWFSLWWPATIVFMCGIGALVAVNVFLLAHELTGKLWIAIAVWLPIAFSNPVMTFSYMLFTELTAGLLVIYAFRRLALGWGANNKWRLLVVGLCIAYLPWIAWRCIFISGVLALYAGVQWWRYARSKSQDAADGEGQQARGISKSLPQFLWIVVPSLISGVLVLSYNLFLYNSITPSNRMPEDGREALFHWPWLGGQHLILFLMGAFGQLFDRQFGLLIYAPFYLLAVVGMIAMFRSARRGDRNLLLWIGLLAVPYMIVLTAFFAWNGVWSPPARYLTTFVPLMAAPLAMSLYVCRNWLYKIIYALMVLPAFALMAVLINDARQMWPSNGNEAAAFSWLAQSNDSPVRINLKPYLINYVTPDDIRHPAGSGWYIAIAALIVMVCYLLFARNRAAIGERRLPAIGQGAAWLGAFVVLGAGWGVMNLNYLSHRTLLLEQRRWALNPGLAEPYGITYFDGKVYLTAFRGASVNVLDTNTGKLTYLRPISATETLRYSYPGDVKLGPDGLLYVLNNGDNTQAMYAMRPDGQIVREIPLNGKSNVAIGFQFGTDGQLYVSDMIGGKIIKYDINGGDPIFSWAGRIGSLENVAGVAVDKDGMVFAGVTSGLRVEQMDPNGKSVRDYDVQCKAMEMTAHDEWIDLVCDKGFMSLNKKDGSIQLSRMGDNDARLQSPTGLAYSPDGHLYILDSNNVIEYKVQH